MNHESNVSRALAGAVFTAALGSQNANAQEFTDSWRFTIGAGVISRPEYPGSDKTKVEALPLLSATYGRYFIGAAPGAAVPAGLGAYLYQDDHWRFGIAAGGGFSKPRKESDDPRLRGLGDIDITARGSMFASYTIDWFTVRGNVSSDIGGNHQGILASLDLEGKYRPTDRLTLIAGPGITWADSEYTRTFFGIDAAQSSASGRPQYRTSSGINTLRLSFGAEYRMTPNWNLGARATAATLRGDAADSPITADKSQNTFGIFTSYRF
jgi:outer membrane protein